jgi:hypothetical protein
MKGFIVFMTTFMFIVHVVRRLRKIPFGDKKVYTSASAFIDTFLSIIYGLMLVGVLIIDM